MTSIQQHKEGEHTTCVDDVALVCTSSSIIIVV
jgi:hypothetical protein